MNRRCHPPSDSTARGQCHQNGTAFTSWYQVVANLPAMPILIGTASWTDKTLIASGRFYPPEATSAEARLRYYASRVPRGEGDSSYYAMPSASNAALWVARTPGHFVFDVKAFRLFTGHQTAPEALHQDIRRALQAAGVVDAA